MGNFFKKIGEALKKAFGFTTTWYARLGLNKFLDKYLADAVKLIAKLAAANNNAAFIEWEKEAWAEVQALTGEVKGTWITILISVAFELFKAQSLPASQKEQL